MSARSTQDHGAWTVVVPVKSGAVGKSRLASFAGPHRSHLARAMALDTVSAALACARVAEVIAVTPDPDTGAQLSALGAVVVSDEPGLGLNAALTYGAKLARDRRPGCAVAAMLADLPALRPDQLDVALEAAEAHPTAYVADAAGVGTTLYCARPDAEFSPRFGPGSREAHRAAGAVELDLADIPSVRQDVDTEADLRAAVRLGVGPRTQAALEPLEGLSSVLMQATVRSFDPDSRSGTVLTDTGVELPYDASALVGSGLRHLRIGQRVALQIEGEGADQRVRSLSLYTMPS
jgi:2-phospho-L-lactate guanylyltransferase